MQRRPPECARAMRRPHLHVALGNMPQEWPGRTRHTHHILEITMSHRNRPSSPAKSSYTKTRSSSHSTTSSSPRDPKDVMAVKSVPGTKKMPNTSSNGVHAATKVAQNLKLLMRKLPSMHHITESECSARRHEQIPSPTCPPTSLVCFRPHQSRKRDENDEQEVSNTTGEAYLRRAKSDGSASNHTWSSPSWHKPECSSSCKSNCAPTNSKHSSLRPRYFASCDKALCVLPVLADMLLHDGRKRNGVCEKLVSFRLDARRALVIPRLQCRSVDLESKGSCFATMILCNRASAATRAAPR